MINALRGIRGTAWSLELCLIDAVQHVLGHVVGHSQTLLHHIVGSASPDVPLLTGVRLPCRTECPMCLPS